MGVAGAARGDQQPAFKQAFLGRSMQGASLGPVALAVQSRRKTKALLEKKALQPESGTHSPKAWGIIPRKKEQRWAKGEENQIPTLS